MYVTAKHILHNSHAIAKRTYYCNKTHVTQQQNTYFYDNSHVIRDVNPKSEKSIQNLKIDEPLPTLFFCSFLLWTRILFQKLDANFIFFQKTKLCRVLKKIHFHSWPKLEHRWTQYFAVVSIGERIGDSAWSYYIRVAIKINVQHSEIWF